MTCHCCNGPASRFGRFNNRNRVVQRYRCNRCGKCFSEAQPMDGMRTENDKVIHVVKLITEGVGIRGCSRLTGLHQRTVLAILETVGRKCAAFMDGKLRNLTTPSLQIDEIWSRVGIRQARTEVTDMERGDFYTFTALDARTKLIVAHHTGKRDYRNTDAFVKDLASRIVGRVQITTDGWLAYPDTIRKYLLYRLDYAVVHKIYGPEDGCPEQLRRYSPHVCTAMEIKVKAGCPHKDRINTSFVERSNLTMRHFNKRFVRLGLGWSRKLENHRHAIAMFMATYNFCKVHKTLGCTPAMGAHLASEAWTIEKLLSEILAPS